MTTVTIGLLVFVVMVVLIVLGCPIFLSMMITCFGGFWAVGGFNMAVTQFTTAPLNIGASYSYAVLPLFMLIGSLSAETGIAQGAFDSFHKWLGRIRGGLLYTVVGANAVFGACSGIDTAGSITFGRLAMPELRKAGYDESMSLGLITSAGTLSSLIPPSVPIILMCMLMDNVSISTALSYGLCTGIMMILLFCVGVFVIVRIFPNKVPSTTDMPKVPMKEKLASLKNLIPIVLVFALIVGGTMLGWFAATVAGAVAAVVLTVFALIKRVPVKRIAHCYWDACVVNASFFPIIIAGNMFGRFVAVTGMVNGIANFINNLHMPNYFIFLIIVLFYLFCGCFMDILSSIIITVPIVLPLMTGMGYSQYIVVILLVMAGELAQLTPPIGMNVFAVSSALRVKPAAVFKGAMPFFFMELALVLLFGAFPGLISWLPALLGL